ncbi:MAG: lytic transglycosylase domain-containing protein, partial [Paracoccaceae bacterium]
MRNALILLFLMVFIVLGTSVRASPESKALGAAMEAVSAGDWKKAARLAKPAGQIGQDIVDWHRLRAGAGHFSEYIAFLGRRSDWPGLPLMRRSGEASIQSSTSAKDIIVYFSELLPQTGTGAIRLAAAYESIGDTKNATAEIVRVWRELPLTKTQETTMLANYSPALINHHRARQDMLLWRGLTKEAERLNSLVGKDYKALARARIGLIKNGRGLSALIKAIPEELADNGGLAYARFERRATKGDESGAIELMLKHSGSATALGNPEAWADRRRAMARQMMRDGKPKIAYELAANHHLNDGDDFIDL